jgi:hypothetical protein
MPKANVHELYDLDSDVHEKTNIAEKHPETVLALKEIVTVHSSEVDVR